MRSELEALKKYIFNGGKISYNCDESSVCSFVELLKPEYFYLFDAPDMFVKKDDYVLIIEHFAFDCYKVKKKGSEHRRELARIQRKEDAMQPTEDGTKLHEVVHGESSYEDYIANVTRSFYEHYSHIDLYQQNLKNAGIITEKTKVEVMFFIEDVSPLGTVVFNSESEDGGIVMVTLADSKEFLDLLNNNNRLDYVLACSTYNNTREIWFIDCHQLDEYYGHVIDYASMQFLNFKPHVVAFKKLVPEEQLEQRQGE